MKRLSIISLLLFSLFVSVGCGDESKKVDPNIPTLKLNAYNINIKGGAEALLQVDYTTNQSQIEIVMSPDAAEWCHYVINPTYIEFSIDQYLLVDEPRVALVAVYGGAASENIISKVITVTQEPMEEPIDE